MQEAKTKRPTSRRPRKDAGSPEPVGPTGGMPTNDAVCGHSGCGRMCNVRYVGPTSHVHDHHIIHAARGIAHVWTAAIVAGLAVVLTGAIAYASVEAVPSAPRQTLSFLTREIKQMNQHLEQIETVLRELDSARASMRRPGVPSELLSCVDRCAKSIEVLFPGAPLDIHKRIVQCVAEHCDGTNPIQREDRAVAPTTKSSTPTSSRSSSCVAECATRMDVCTQDAARDPAANAACVDANDICDQACGLL